MTNPITQRIEEVKKGCGKRDYYPNYPLIECGRLYLFKDNKYSLCPICQAKLDTLKFCEEAFKEMIENEIKIIREAINSNLGTISENNAIKVRNSLNERIRALKKLLSQFNNKEVTQK